MGKELSVLMVGHDEYTERYIYILLKRKFSSLNFKTTQNGLEAIDMYKKQKFNLVFIELFLPGMNGIPVIKEIKSMDASSRVVLYTSRIIEVDGHFQNNKDDYDIETLPKPSPQGELDKIICDIKTESVAV